MLSFLLFFLAPDEKLPPGSSQVTLGSEGLPWGWAFFILILLIAATTWSYFEYGSGLSKMVKVGLIVIRSCLIGLLLLLLVRPVLFVSLSETTRRTLLVLVDTTQSMNLVDSRKTPENIGRAAIAMGLIDPAGGLNQSVPNDAVPADLSRKKLLEAIAGNSKLNLWPRIYDHANLVFYGFGRKISELGDLTPPEGGTLTPDESVKLFHSIQYNENLTAIGDGLKDVLNDQRGQSLAGILLLTDGANNSGSSPIDAADIAKQDGVPLYTFGLGITDPQDIFVSELSGPNISDVDEKADFIVHIRAQGVIGQTATVQLKVKDEVVDEQKITFKTDGEQKVTLSYIPKEIGHVDVEAYVPPLSGEAVKDNNSAGTGLNVIDGKVKVLYIEGEPRWDFQYLLGMLQRDRRIKLKCFLAKGDPGLSSYQDSPFIDTLPDDKKTLFDNDLIIIGDVDPNAIGIDRMKMIEEWVNKMGGGLIFLAGQKSDPMQFHGTPLEPLLPIKISGKTLPRNPDSMHIKLTPEGEASSMMGISKDEEENLGIWKGFDGVHWISPVDKVHPAAQVLATAVIPGSIDPQPVIISQNYGLGQTLFIGTGETYRWRAHQGEKYYTQLWSQFIQILTSQHNGIDSSVVKTDRPRYFTGDRVKITAKLVKTGFEPVTDSQVAGILSIQGADPSTNREVDLQAIPGKPGEYHAETMASIAGVYTYALKAKPATNVKFEAIEPNVELSDVAMNEGLLKQIANVGGGHYFREEDINTLPDMIANRTAETTSIKKIPLSFSLAMFISIISLGVAEWFIRRLLELK